MSYTIQGGTLLPARVKLTSTSATDIVSATNSGLTIVEIIATEIAGGTPSLTLEVYDGTTSYYLQNAKAMTARERIVLSLLLPLKTGEKLRATASSANQIDIMATYSPRDATAGNGPTFIPLNQR